LSIIAKELAKDVAKDAAKKVLSKGADVAGDLITKGIGKLFGAGKRKTKSKRTGAGLYIPGGYRK
jgi:hypothetical protein